MKNKLLGFYFFAIALPLSVILPSLSLSSIQSPAAKAVDPCAETANGKNDPLPHDPLVDPVEEMRLRAQIKQDEKNYKELKQAAIDLADVSSKMKEEIEKTGQYAISLRVIDQISQIEKLTRTVKSHAK